MDIFSEFDKSVLSSTGKITVSGILSHMQKSFIKHICSILEFDLIYSSRIDKDIEKYLNSLIVVDSNSKFTQAGFEITLEEFGFTYSTKVTLPGEWSKKGDIITIWPIGYEHPVRISYFDDNIEYFHLIDEIYGVKIAEVNGVFLGDVSILEEETDRSSINVSGYVHPSTKLVIIFSDSLETSKFKEIKYDFEFPQLFYNRIDILEKYLSDLVENKWEIHINTKYKERFKFDSAKYFDDKYKEFSSGFITKKNKIIYLTDRELFGTIFLEKIRQQLTTRQSQKILEQLEGEIEIGDFIVHEDHGIGVYRGIKQEEQKYYKIINYREEVLKRIEDYLSIEYAEGDELLVPILQIHKITKYIATTSDNPEITRLHKGGWARLIFKAKKSVELVAKDLVEHYAKIQTATIDPLEFESSEQYLKFVDTFPYDETGDQLNAINDIMKDFVLDKPMDRLIVGDVGFGKTEVAMRAAFRICEESAQVAVLCPTTVLAAQHFKVFSDRFKPFGISVGYVSRFNTNKINKEIVQSAKDGNVDILIGTHRLLSSDVGFQNLKLVIIDEEQKFGVRQKEKIRQLQYSAHSLTLTATPIPRTLSMAMSQIKEISLISTPPSGRSAIETHVEKIDWSKIQKEITTEVDRGGQVYFVHNKVETIENIKKKLEILIPNVRFVVAHGQMRGNKLDIIIKDFYEGKYDVLVCTTIIENGIDMPNVNTIIVNDGQNFGLGQLYQLRGRVGRSNKQAYCYIYYKGDELDNDANINEEIKNKKKKNIKYVSRLKAILESQDLGSGFKLASKDLEIRGAGNLLGKQQHGNIKNVGLALYMQMLAEEIERLKYIDKL